MAVIECIHSEQEISGSGYRESNILSPWIYISINPCKQDPGV